jgi:hypothetical protein
MGTSLGRGECRDQCHCGDAEVNHDAHTNAEPRRRKMGVQVAEEQHRLEERKDRGPDPSGATEDGQHEPAHQGLDAEQQERRQADREPEWDHGRDHRGRVRHHPSGGPVRAQRRG